MKTHVTNPFRTAEALTAAALQHTGPEFLRRGGAVGRTLSEIRKGASPEQAAAIGAIRGKGHAAELRLAAEQSIDAGLSGAPFFTQPNPIANDRHADLLIRDKGRRAGTVQVGVGKLDYLRQKARTSKAGQVVVPEDVAAALCASGDAACARVADRVTYKGTSSSALSAETVVEDARSILLRAIEADPRVGEWAKLTIAAGGGLASAVDSFGTSLLYEAVERLMNGQPFDQTMVEAAFISAGRTGVRSALQAYLAVDEFLTHARPAFNGRILQKVATGVVWTGAVADIVVSTAVEVWRWMKDEITFEELLRRAGVHVTAAVGGAVGVAGALVLARGAPGWLQVLLVLGLGYLGVKYGRTLGDEIFAPTWQPEQAR